MLKKSLVAGIVIAMGITGGMFCSITIGSEQSPYGFSDADDKMGFSTHGVVEDELVLVGKGKNYVLVGKMRFEVTSNTIIKNRLGMEITLEELTIPGRATVRYYENTGQSNIYEAVFIQEELIPE